MTATRPYSLVRCELPWAVAPSTPLMELRVSENAVVTRLTLVAWFGPHRRQISSGSGGNHEGFATLISSDDLEWNVDGTDFTGEYQHVVVKFDNTASVRMQRVRDDQLDPSEFLDPGAQAAGADGVARLRAEMDAWARSGLCPIPKFYRVAREELDGRCYWLVKGDDAFIEVLAQGWTWQSLGTIRGW